MTILRSGKCHWYLLCKKGIMTAGKSVTLQEGNMRRRESRSWRKRERNLCDWWTNTETVCSFHPAQGKQRARPKSEPRCLTSLRFEPLQQERKDWDFYFIMNHRIPLFGHKHNIVFVCCPCANLDHIFAMNLMCSICSIRK